MNEFEFIRKIAEGVPRSGEGLIKGIDDDAAVIEGPRGINWLVTMDIFAEGVHFERGWADWETIGKKALLVNISDIAAMGGIPWFYFVSASCPKDIREDDLLDFTKGMKSVATCYDMILAGGDTTSSKSNFTVSITVIGNADKDNIIYRNGAKPGDKIYVTGKLGASAAGLDSLKDGEKGASDFVMRHLLPEPRLKLSSWLSKNRSATSMIDISDGLMLDMDHIADESSVGYKIDISAVPLYDGLDSFKRGADLDQLVMASGEEYELLFTMSKEAEEIFLNQTTKIDFGCEVTKIGEVVADKGQRKIVGRDGKELKLKSAGFVHEIGS